MSPFRAALAPALAAVFLAAPAAGFMTGQTMVIDGGVTCGVPLSAFDE